MDSWSLRALRFWLGLIVALCGLTMLAMIGLWLWWAWSPRSMPPHVKDGSNLTFMMAMVLGFGPLVGVVTLNDRIERRRRIERRHPLVRRIPQPPQDPR